MAKQTKTTHKVHTTKHKATPRVRSPRKPKVATVSLIRRCLQPAKRVVWTVGRQLKYVVNSDTGSKCFWFFAGTVVASRFVFQVDARDS